MAIFHQQSQWRGRHSHGQFPCSIGVYTVLPEGRDTGTRSRIVAAFLIVLGVLGLGLLCYGLVIKREAQSLLSDVSELRIGKATAADVQQVAHHHRRFVASQHCEGEVCTTEFEVQNRWLSALKLEPPAAFHVDVIINAGTVTQINATLARAMPIFPTYPASAGLVYEHAEIPRASVGDQEGHYLFPTPVGKPYLKVVLDAEASSVQRTHAFGFSFRCLVKPGWGCDLPCDYLPLAWQDWKQKIKGSGFPMSGFNRAYPNNDRCSQ
jgi:hypothetical protein